MTITSILLLFHLLISWIARINPTVTLSAKDIGKIIQNLDSNKAYGHDNLSICMLNICGDSICVPLEKIFKQALLTGVFPSEWKKGNIVPIHKKDNKRKY